MIIEDFQKTLEEQTKIIDEQETVIENLENSLKQEKQLVELLMKHLDQKT